MAMTKAEKTEMENLRKARDLARALAWPSYPCPQPMTREEIAAAPKVTIKSHGYPNGRAVALGWFQNAYNGRVERGWSDGYSHSIGLTGGGTQKMGTMYRTYDDAARAMRYEMTAELAARLAQVDRLIEQGEPQG